MSTRAQAILEKFQVLPPEEQEEVRAAILELTPPPKKKSNGQRVLKALLKGGVVHGRTEDWLRLTRGQR
jgi:hypothetical protein